MSRITRRQADFLWRAFLRYVTDGYMEAWQVGSKTGRSESAARSALTRLEKRGLVECEEPVPLKWSITDAGKRAVAEILDA